MRASNADRERVAQILHNALAEGRITVQELEERLDSVYAAKTLAELEPPIADLPEVSAGTAVQPAPSRAVDDRIGGTPGSQTSIAIMSGASRKGNWVVPAQHNSFAFWGGVEIDLRSARFAQRSSTITAVAIMGGIDIVVPDDIVVEVTGIGFMGAFESRDDPAAAATPPPPGAPVVRINGFAFWGGVSVTRKPRREP
ncbi:DUF1707 domain-containing protein [Amycolatopsis rhizosphaerae]|uniref:DUF1707 domain-containing protein n=1 Tax=Amycolatopsis rhizosphaerae TaxID=2053003 RepID=A0A558C922_9PSEU|nr:DUF1707 domain-containing protein [Amycolatopsis rhizosphaerae]TVT45278.1 DUF1707 domain-containing protein [Amycolatopsis rhizosphaerae]